MLLVALAAPEHAGGRLGRRLAGTDDARRSMRLLSIPPGTGGAGRRLSIDQAPGRKIPVAPIAIADGRLTFAIPSIGGSYEDEAADAGFSGTFRQARSCRSISPAAAGKHSRCSKG